MKTRIDIPAGMAISYLPYKNIMDWERGINDRGKKTIHYDRDKLVKRLRAFSKAFKVPFLDLTPAMIQQGGRKLYFPLDGHMNAEGHKVVATEVARWLTEANFK